MTDHIPHSFPLSQNNCAYGSGIDQLTLEDFGPFQLNGWLLHVDQLAGSFDFRTNVKGIFRFPHPERFVQLPF